LKLAIFLQYITPKQLITVIAGKLANLECKTLTPKVIAWFVKRYQVNMAEAADSDIQHYKTFNDFFTRPLKSGARPIATVDFICPVDGAISQFGTIKMTYVPGDLFSVNPTTAENVPNLFARNERVVCEFSSEKHGTFVLVLVGATIVGSMATVWHGQVNPPRSKSINTWSYTDQDIRLAKGEEMGRFLLGSTVVMLFEKEQLTFTAGWQPAKSIQLGEAMSQT